MTQKSQQSRFARILFMILGGVTALIVIAALIVSLIQIPIDLSRHKGRVESVVSNALGRTVKVDGEIAVTTSLWPYFVIKDIRIANPEGFEQGDLASIKLARINVGLLPLLKSQIHIKEFRVEGLALNLVKNEHGAVNWVLSDPVGESVPKSQRPTVSSDALAVDKLLLEDISVSFHNRIESEELKFSIEKATGTAAFGEAMALSMNGVLLEEPFTLRVEANSLRDFLEMTHSQLGFQVDIAETHFQFSGSSDALSGKRTSELKVKVEGEQLNSLNDLTRLDLPPLVDYRIGAELTMSPGLLELSDMELAVKDSALKGTVVVDKTGVKPFATIQLTADSIQLDDFETGDWSPVGSDAEPAEEAVADPGQEPPGKRAKPLDPEALNRANAKLEIRIGEVLSGEDKLGSGELTLELKDGRLSLDPLQLHLPGSNLFFQASVKPGLQASDASLRVLIEKFDFGVLTRLSNPDSEVGGTLNMDIDVKASASSFQNLLAGANGYLDLSGNPENIRAGAVDLWAVNLLSSVVTSSVEDENDSQINCIISRWSLENGVMTAANLAIDTSKIRICGKGEIDFNEQAFNLTMSPTAKRPEFFSLATPLAVRGGFEDFSIGAKTGILSVGATAVKFTISPLTTPIKRLVRDDLPEDGGDICNLPIGSHEGELGDLPGC